MCASRSITILQSKHQLLPSSNGASRLCKLVKGVVKLARWQLVEFSEFRHRKSLDYFKTHMLDEDKYEEVFMIFLEVWLHHLVRVHGHPPEMGPVRLARDYPYDIRNYPCFVYCGV